MEEEPRDVDIECCDDDEAECSTVVDSDEQRLGDSDEAGQRRPPMNEAPFGLR